MLDADAVPLTRALTGFTGWMEANAQADGLAGVQLWSKGPSFDPVILAAAYRAVGMPQPWDFRNERCVRTMLDMARVDMTAYQDPASLRHDALQDALAQTAAVQAGMRRCLNAIPRTVTARSDMSDDLSAGTGAA